MNTFAALLLAQLGLFGAASTNVVITSSNVVERAWERKVVMRTGDGDIINDNYQVGESASVAAADEVADRSAEIGEAANVALTDSLALLTTAQASAATNAISLALVIPPETDRTNLTAYVVKTESFDNGTKDRQWVWYNRALDLAPNRFVVYETFGESSTNKVVWMDWANPVSVTVNGRTWSGCHVCEVARPTWAVGLPCLDCPNDKWGGPTGIEWGDIVLTMGGVPLFTGFVTNGVTGKVAYFDNGFFKGFTEE